MDNILLFLCFLITLSWIPTTEGLQCPSCTYLNVTLDAEIYLQNRAAIDRILDKFQDQECGKDLNGPIPEIQNETCNETPGEVSICIFYNGLVTITVTQPNVSVPLQIYHRGCYHFRSENVPSDGCHDRDNITEDETSIKQSLDKDNSTSDSYDVARFSGEMCLCTHTYCRATTSINPLQTTTGTSNGTMSKAISGGRLSTNMSTNRSGDLQSTATSSGLKSTTTSSGLLSTTTAGASECAKGNTLLLLFFALFYFI